eukprot:1170413-Pyramimonas_sp.AAC.1
MRCAMRDAGRDTCAWYDARMARRAMRGGGASSEPSGALRGGGVSHRGALLDHLVQQHLPLGNLPRGAVALEHGGVHHHVGREPRRLHAGEDCLRPAHLAAVDVRVQQVGEAVEGGRQALLLDRAERLLRPISRRQISASDLLRPVSRRQISARLRGRPHAANLAPTDQRHRPLRWKISQANQSRK